MHPLKESHNRLLAAILIGAGVLLLVLRQFDWRLSDSLWPFIIIVPGFALFALAAALGRDARQLAVVGAVTGGTGLILLGQSLTDYFQSWAYVWTLLPVFAGLALVVMEQRDGDAATKGAGRSLILTGGVLFVVFTTLFEGLIFHRGLVGNGIIVPAVLIVLGIVLLVRNSSGKNGGAGVGTPPKATGPGPTQAVRP